MRILIYAMGSAGDVHPFTGVGRALQARGHEVFIITSAFFEELVRRAGLDYHEFAAVKLHANFDALIANEKPPAERMFALTTRGVRLIGDVEFKPNDWFVFGNETAGLSDGIRERFESIQRIRLPMRPGNRSLNLSNAVAVVIFEAWRQANYSGGR